MTKHYLLIFPAIFATVLTACSNSRPDSPVKGPGITYRDLMLKDYDEMYAMVKSHTRAAHKMIEESDNNSDWQEGARSELLVAERLILSRPDSDNMVAKLTPEVKREIAMFGNYDDLLETLTKEGIQAFDSNMNLPTTIRTTQLFVLENLMSEIQPEVKDNAREREMLEQIRDAKIDLPSDVVAERKLQGMFLATSPSDEAKRILVAAGFKKKR